MAPFPNSTGRWLRRAWLLPLVLLALPGCFLQSGPLGPPAVFDGGLEPRTSVIMCDIPKVPQPGGSDCADSIETGFGMSMSEAAIALVQGESSSLALDFSQAATDACFGLPRKTEFHGAFPDGYAVCLNCGGQIPSTYADATAVCVAKCIDLIHYGELPEPEGSAESFCQLNARLSTNFDKITTCYAAACSSGGTPLPNFVDPRRTQEPVKWVHPIGTATAGNPGNTLVRTSATSAPPAFDAGDASAQLIMKGDGWVEFEATDNTRGHAVGLSAVPVLQNGAPPDDDPTLADIGFALVLDSDGNVYIYESGTKVPGSLSNGSVATYNAGDRFRVRVKDNNGVPPNTATITYHKLTAPCSLDGGTICASVQIGGQTASSPSYPLRVDASLKELGATLKDVTVVRIQ